MKKNKYIKCFAAILLFVFSFNTIIGFACAIGIDMSYNTVHHHDEAEVADTHDDHDEKNSQVANGSQVRHHEHKDDDTKSTNKNDDNCCNHKVVDIAQLDKAIPQSVQLNHVFFADFIPVFYNSPTSYSSGFIKSNKYFVRSHHPPIPDIRIAIQSFQI